MNALETTPAKVTDSIVTEKVMAERLERLRQSDFAREQSNESVMTRPIESIVDVDN